MASCGLKFGGGGYARHCENDNETLLMNHTVDKNMTGNNNTGSY